MLFELNQTTGSRDAFRLSFRFLRDYGRVLIESILLYGLPQVILIAAAFLLLFPDHFSLVQDLDHGAFRDALSMRDSFRSMLISGTFLYLSTLPAGIITCIVVWQASRHPDRQPTRAEIWAVIKEYYLRILAAKLVMLPLIFFPAFLFILPGLVFYTFFGGVEMLMMDKRYGPTEAIAQTFDWMGKDFWANLGVHLVLFLVYCAANAGLMLPEWVWGLIQHYTNATVSDSVVLSVLFGVYKVMTYLAGSFLYVIPAAGASLLYLVIREQREAVGLLHRVQHIGEHIVNPSSVYGEDEAY